MAAYVLTCLEADFDPATQTCAAPFYSEKSTSLPELSIEDAQLIGAAIAFLLATAFIFRLLRKFVLST